MKKVILLLLLSVCTYSQVISIDSARHLDTGTVVTLRCVVTTQREFTLGIVYFQDPTGGLAAFSVPFCNAVDRGDSIQVTGKLKNFNNLLELDPVTSWNILDSGKVVNPLLATTNNIRLNGENYESKLIRINSITRVRNITTGLIVNTWNAVGSGTNFRIFSGGDSCELRVYSTTNLVNTAIPDTFDVVAIGSQFNTTYQILPRSISDIIPRLTGGSGPLLSSITYTNITPTGVTVNWQSSTSSNSKVRWQLADSNYQVVAYTDSVSNASNVTNHSVALSGLQPGRIYYYNVSSTDGNGTTTSALQYFCTQSNSTGAINVYFNRSVDTTLSSGENAQGNVNFQTKLLQRINAAQYSIDMALYSCNDLTQFRDALINAKLRGVKIRFVYDSRTPQALVNDITAAGIPMIQRTISSGIMHDKFFIFDYRYNTSHTNCWVWTGSTNITNDQFYTDANNVIELQDRSLAAVYTREFEEMWGSATDLPIVSRSKFGANKTDNTPHKLNLNGTPVEAYFTPGDNGTLQLQNLVTNNFDYDCFFSIYVFTDFNIANRMKSRYISGRYVRGIFDRDTSGGVYQEMKGLGPFAWNPPADILIDFAEGSGIFHHKYMIIDPLNVSSNPVVETGSYNYSGAANTTNDENMLMIYSPRVANLYVQEWYKRYKVSGGSAVIGIEQISSEVPNKFELKQNYPNPFNPSTSIQYSVAKNSSVMLRVYDVTGKAVQTLVNENQEAGIYKVSLKALNMASGIYFYTLEADGVRIDSKKMILVK